MMVAEVWRKTLLERIIPVIVLGILFLALVLTSYSAYAADDFTVTLLGTGTPAPSPERFGMSTLVKAGGQRLLFDTSRLRRMN